MSHTGHTPLHSLMRAGPKREITAPPLDLAGLLARHIGNCCVKVDARGVRVVKEHKMSTNRIDLAVAAIMAYSIAVAPAPAPPQMFVFDE